MRAKERRKEIVTLLSESAVPVSGGALAELTGVSRQIIVQDIALLKAQGYDILSTHTGYVLNASPLAERVFKVRHTSSETEQELRLIVSLGGTVADVFVWHKVYGKIAAPLGIFSERSMEQFLDGIKSGRSKELMHITDGYHYHTVRADSSQILDTIEGALREKGFLISVQGEENF